MIIALDAMGGDRAPAEPVKGAVLAARELGIGIALVGPTDILHEELSRHGTPASDIDIVAATEVVTMDDSPVQAVRQKKDASINVAMGLVKRGVANAVVSAGNTGAVMASALLNLGRVRGIERPAIGTMAPFGGSGMLVLDVGANPDCRPSYLMQFAEMGSVYMERVYGVQRPRVGLLNIGEESTKGNELMLEVHERLRTAGLNFVGNIEPDRVTRQPLDVLVTDGFTGNIAVKMTEGVADFIFGELRSAITSSLRYKLAALLLRPALLSMRQRMDYGEYGGAPLLGVDGVVIVAHGRADGIAIKNAVRTAHEAARSGMIDVLREHFGREAAAAGAASSDETRA